MAENNFLPELGFAPSAEQLDIVDALRAGKNVIAQAVAGAGKTSVVLALAALTHQRVLHITYNKELQTENSEKIAESGLKSYVDSYTIHGLAYRIARQNKLTRDNKPLVINDDDSFDYFLKAEWNFFQYYDYLVIDEVQDATVSYLAFFRRLWAGLPASTRCLVLGDKRQTIYAMKGSASTCLNDFDKFTEKPFVKLTLGTSFRVPDAVCQELNHTYLNQQILRGFKTGGRLLAPVIHETKTLGQKIIKFIQDEVSKGATYDEFFVLALSLKQEGIINLANELVSAGIPVHFPLRDEAKANQDVLRNKVAFSTVYQAKGRERRYVILPYLTTSAYKSWLQDKVNAQAYTEQMPNIYYVAYTRAKETIYAPIHDYQPAKNKPSEVPPFLNKAVLEQLKTGEFVYEFDHIIHKPVFNFSAEDSPTKFLNELTIRQLNDNFSADLKVAKKPDYHLRINAELKTDDFNYTTEIQVLNSQFLFLNYLKTANLRSFLAWQYECFAKINEKAKILPNKDALKKAWIELGITEVFNLARWNNATTETKLRYLACYFAAVESHYTYLQLPHYHWLDEFSDQSTVNELFSSFKISQWWNQVDAYVSDAFTALAGAPQVPFLDGANQHFVLSDLVIPLINKNKIFFFKGTRQRNSIDDTLIASWALLAANELHRAYDIIVKTYNFHFFAADLATINAKITEVRSDEWQMNATDVQHQYFSLFSQFLNWKRRYLQQDGNTAAKFVDRYQTILTEGVVCAYILNYVTGETSRLAYNKEAIVKNLRLWVAEKTSVATHDEPFAVKKPQFDALWAKMPHPEEEVLAATEEEEEDEIVSPLDDVVETKKEVSVAPKPADEFSVDELEEILESAENTAAEKPAAEKPAAEKPAAEKPAAKNTAPVKHKKTKPSVI